jgi:outer membrane protein
MLKNIITNFIISTILVFGVYFLIESKQKKIVFVKLSYLYEGFQMKKDLEQKYNSLEKSRKAILDSLELELKLETQMLDSKGKNLSKSEYQDFDQKRERYYLKKQQFEEDNTAVANQYSDQVFKRINQYVADYGKIKGYDLIIGADGSGVVMHGNDALDITNDVLFFLNNSYTGVKK